MIHSSFIFQVSKSEYLSVNSHLSVSSLTILLVYNLKNHKMGSVNSKKLLATKLSSEI
jgi:hypothetical protein